MAKTKVERTGLKSGWCGGFDLSDTKQHQGCKEIFEVRGYPTWECTCECHGNETVTEQEPKKMSPEERAATTKAK